MVAASTGTELVTVRVVKSRTETLAGANPPHCTPQFRTYAVFPLMIAFTGRENPELRTVQIQEEGGLCRQLVSTIGNAFPGASTVTLSESLLKTRSWLPPPFETTVCALGTAMVVVMPPADRFITISPPTNV